MPNTKSAERQLRKNIARRERNRSARRSVKTLCGNVIEALDQGPEQAQAEFVKAVKSLDQAASKGIIHPNAAARRKSRLSAKLKAAKKA